MKTRLLILGAAVILSAVPAACGGGGGGGGGGGPVPPPPTATPTVKPTVNPFGCVGSSPFAVSRRTMAVPHPVATGDTFAYSGNYVDTYTQSEPCAQPTATSAATIAQSVSNVTPVGGPPGATVDQQVAETDAFPTRSVATTTHNYLAVTASAYQLFGTKASDSNGNVLTQTFATPQQLDTLAAPPQSWTNDPSSTLTETLTDGTHASRATHSDGSYVDTETFSDGSTAVITVGGAATGGALDGSGSYALQYNAAAGTGLDFAYAAPASGNITLTANVYGTSSVRTFLAWFTVPAAYITDSFQANGTKPLDSSCTVNSAIATQGKQVVETYSVLDPVLGYKEARTVTTYNVDGYGAVCVLLDDTLSSYYDYALDTTSLLYYSRDGTANSVDHIAQTISMASPVTPYPNARTASARRSGVSPQVVAARVAAIELYREGEREQRVRAAMQSLRTLGGKGSK